MLVSNSFSGAENVVCTLIQNDNLNDTFYCSPSGDIEKVLKKRNINFIPLKTISPCSIKKIAKENEIDIIHAHDFKASFICALSGFKGKIISQIHCNPDFLKTKNIYTIFYNLISKRFYKIIMVSQQIFVEYYYHDNIKNKAVIIENCVDEMKIKKLSNEKKLKESYDVGYLGRLSKEKNPISFIRIIKEISFNYPEVRAVIIGDGTMMRDCRKMVKELDLLDNIEFVGFQNNPYLYIRNCKTMIMPSLVEGFGLAAIESMVLGKPVINSGVGGLKNIFKKNKWFMYKDEKDAAKKIISLLQNQENYIICSDKSVLISKEYTDIKKWKNKITSCYD